jgi:hypothetical protein
MEGVRFRLVRGVGERQEAVGSHDGEAVQCKARRGDAFVNELAAVDVGGRGRTDPEQQNEDEDEDEGCSLGKHSFFRHWCAQPQCMLCCF